MNHARVKLVIGGLVLSLAVGYLAMAGVKKGWVYFLDVDVYVAEAQYHSQRVRLSGVVAEDGLMSQPAQLQAQFVLLGKTQRMAVTYHGVVPEMFRPGVEVIIEGRRDETGIFQADLLMTKCASKYESLPPNHPTEPTGSGQHPEVSR